MSDTKRGGGNYTPESSVLRARVDHKRRRRRESVTGWQPPALLRTPGLALGEKGVSCLRHEPCSDITLASGNLLFP